MRAGSPIRDSSVPISETASAAASPSRQLILEIFSGVLLAAAIFAVIYAFVPNLIASHSSSPEIIRVSPSTIFKCKARTDDVVVAPFTIRNITLQPITILGAHTGCSCTIVEGLPLKVNAGESRKIDLRVTVGHFNNSGMFSKSAQLYADVSGTIPPLAVQISAMGEPLTP